MISNEGGTYSGAVAPCEAIQLTPETRSGGYDCKDNSIRFLIAYSIMAAFRRMEAC